MKVIASPAVSVAAAGRIRRPLTGGMTSSDAVPLTSRPPRSTVPVTTCSPVRVGVHVDTTHEPLGPTVKTAHDVRSMTGRPPASRPMAVYRMP